MSKYSKVVWSEGLFLQPEHFQQQERYFEGLIINRPEISGLTPWGFLEYNCDLHLLPQGKFKLNSCRGILPDGTAFNAPAIDNLPSPIDIPKDAVDSPIYLCLPLSSDGAPEIGLTADSTYRYRAERVEMREGEHVTQLQLGRLSLQLKLGSDTLGGYSYLSIAKIKEVLLDKTVKLDESFIPPCLNIYAVPKLADFAKKLLNLLYHRGKTLDEQYFNPSRGGGSEIMDMVLLNIINRAEVLLQFWVSKKRMHPEQFFLYLSEMLGSLAIFSQQYRHVSVSKLPSYQHCDLKSSFEHLMSKLEQALTQVVEHKSILLALKSKDYGMWSAPLEDKNLVRHAQFVLAVSADLPSDVLSQRVLSTIKIAAVDKIQELITHAVPGITLQPLTMIPREIPIKTEQTYFALNKTSEFWQELLSSTGIAIHVANEILGLKLQLWAIRDTNGNY